MRLARLTFAWFVVAPLAMHACALPEEAPQVNLPVVTDSSGITAVTTDLGYEVELTVARLVMADMRFTIAGEVQTASLGQETPLWQKIQELCVPIAYAHPGHYQGGDVTGELQGRYFLDWLADPSAVSRGKTLFAEQCASCHDEDAEGLTGPSLGGHPWIADIVRTGRAAMPAFDIADDDIAAIQAYLSTHLGKAKLLLGDYKSVNFTFSTATVEDGLPTGDAIVTHTAILQGTATQGDISLEFVAMIDAPEDRELIGVPFEFQVKATTTEQLGIRLLSTDPVEGGSLFDGIDFAALTLDTDGKLKIDERATDESIIEAYNWLRRAFLTHDYYNIRPSQP